MNDIEIYTDGACAGNPGNGGWATITYDKDSRIIYDAYCSELIQNTTNNRMEIEAILMALKLADTKYANKKVTIYSDSAYCVNMFNSWITTWAGNGWMNSKKETVANLDLVKMLYQYKKIEFPNFQVVKCAGHTKDNIGNQLADAYAVSAYSLDASKIAKIIKENDITLEIE